MEIQIKGYSTGLFLHDAKCRLRRAPKAAKVSARSGANSSMKATSSAGPESLSTETGQLTVTLEAKTARWRFAAGCLSVGGAGKVRRCGFSAPRRASGRHHEHGAAGPAIVVVGQWSVY